MMVEEKFLAKIIPVDNPDLKEVKLSLNTETCLGRGRKTNILDKYISRNQIRIKLIKTQSGYKLDFTPLAKPSFIQRENEASVEIQAGKTEVLSPNDTFYISRLKFPYKFQLLPEVEEENEAEEATPEELSRDGPTVDEANLPAENEATVDQTEEATNVDNNKDDNVEEAEIEIDAGEKLDIEMEEENEQKEEEENETTDANKTVDEVDYDQRLDEEQEDDSVIIEYSQENIKSTVNIDNNNVSPKEGNVLITKEVLEEDNQPKEEEGEKEEEKEEEEKEEKEEEKMEEELEEKEEELEEEKKEEEKEEEEKEEKEEVSVEDAIENSTSTQDIFPISQSSPTSDATRKITIQETIITEEITSPPAIAASSQVIHNYPPLSSDPSFILLMNKVSSLESQLKTVLGEFGEKLNKVVEICSPRVTIQKPKQDGYESDVSSEAKESPSVKRANTKVVKKVTTQKMTEEDLEKQREKERKEKEAKEAKEAKELEKKKEKERKEKEREKERIRKEKEKQEKKERERLEKEAKQKEREKQKEEEAKAKKTPPPKSGKRKRSESEDVAESPASQPNKKKKSEASEKWSADQERRFRWAGDQYKSNQKTFYSAVVIDDETYSIGDTVYLTSPIDVPYYIGKILALWEDNKGKKLVQISWFFYHADVTEILGPKVAKQFGVEAFQKKLYGSIQTDINPVVTIERKCDVKHLSELGEFASNPKKWAVASADRYYFEKYFDSRTKKISYNPDTDSLEMMFEYPDKRIS